jgi:type I restriction enzyme S subunit
MRRSATDEVYGMVTGNGWRSVSLSEIADIVSGGTPSTSVLEYWDPPEIDWVTAKDISECQLAKIHETERRISKKGLENSSAKMLPALTTVLIARGATMGKCRMLARSMALNQTCYGIVAKNGTDPVYLHYCLSNLYEYFRSMAHGSVFDTVISSGLRSLSVSIPPLPIQRRIAAILGALDDKIEVNRRINRTLEAMAGALYKRWFVDFGPFQDGEFVESEVGLIPEGWTIKPLPEAIEVNPKRTLSKDQVAPYLEMSNMPTSSARVLGWRERAFKSGMRFVNGDVLVARITPCLEHGKTALVDFLAEGQVGWGSTEYIVLHSKPPLPPEYVYFLARSEDFRSYAIKHMTGTSGRQRVPVDCFSSYLIVVPSWESTKEFEQIARLVMATIKQLDTESHKLAATRDYLLPRLLSGEIPVEVGKEAVGT